MSEWYLKTPTEELGPFSAAELRAKVKAGQLRIDSQIRRSGDRSWIVAGRVKGLFPTSGEGDGNSVSSSTAPPESPSTTTSDKSQKNIFVFACAGLVFLLTVLNAILVVTAQRGAHTTEATAKEPDRINYKQAYENLVERLDSLARKIEQNEERVNQLANKADMPRLAPAQGDPSSDRMDLSGIADVAPAGAPQTPREVFLAKVRERYWIESYYIELSIGGKAVRSNNLAVRVDKVTRDGDRLDLFVTVTNIGTGEVFSPQTHPYNEQMVFTTETFVDSFMNRSVISLERGTQDLKPGESATIQYSADIKMEAPFYLWTIFLRTGNDDLASSSYFIVLTPGDFSRR